MNKWQKIVLVVFGIIIALRTFNPVQKGSQEYAILGFRRIDYGATLLQMVGIASLGGALFFVLRSKDKGSKSVNTQ